MTLSEIAPTLNSFEKVIQIKVLKNPNKPV
jgi:hypothetical protein